jgi:hypothetical protein
MKQRGESAWAYSKSYLRNRLLQKFRYIELIEEESKRRICGIIWVKLHVFRHRIERLPTFDKYRLHGIKETTIYCNWRPSQVKGSIAPEALPFSSNLGEIFALYQTNKKKKVLSAYELGRFVVLLLISCLSIWAYICIRIKECSLSYNLI